MSWLPARVVAPIVMATAPLPVVATDFTAAEQGYLREFFEAVLRVRAADHRLTHLPDLAELVSRYATVPTENVAANLRALNLALAPADAARNPPATHGSEPRWAQLALTAGYVTAASDAAAYVELVTSYASSLAELRACREVVECAIALLCQDARRAYIKGADRTELLRLTQGDIELLREAYHRINLTVARLDLDLWLPLLH